MQDIKFFLVAFALGLGIAFIYSFYNSRVFGKFVWKLISIDATSPDSAVLPEEIDIKLSFALKQSLKGKSSFSQTVLQTEENKFYINPEQLEKAKIKYKSNDMTIFIFFIILILLAGITIIGVNLFPGLKEKLYVWFNIIP